MFEEEPKSKLWSIIPEFFIELVFESSSYIVKGIIHLIGFIAEIIAEVIQFFA